MAIQKVPGRPNPNGCGPGPRGAVTLARAQPPEDTIAAPRFDVERYAMEGNTLLTAPEIERTLAPYTGKQRSFADVPARAGALERALPRGGLGAGAGHAAGAGHYQRRRPISRYRGAPRESHRRSNRHFSTANCAAACPRCARGRCQLPRDGALPAGGRREPAKQTTALLRSVRKTANRCHGESKR